METMSSMKKSLRSAFGLRTRLRRELDAILDACGIPQERAHLSHDGKERRAVTVWAPGGVNPLGTITLNLQRVPGATSHETFVTLSMNHAQDQEHYNLELDRHTVHVRVRAMAFPP